MAPFVFAQGLKGGPYLPIPILVIPRSSHRKIRPRTTCLQPHSRRPRRLRGDHRPPVFNRVPICDASRAIAGTADHSSFRKSRCGGQIMPICESSRSVAIARSCFCRRFPRSEFLKRSLPYITPRISTFFVHGESASRKKGLGAQEQHPATRAQTTASEHPRARAGHRVRAPARRASGHGRS